MVYYVVLGSKSVTADVPVFQNNFRQTRSPYNNKIPFYRVAYPSMYGYYHGLTFSPEELGLIDPNNYPEFFFWEGNTLLKVNGEKRDNHQFLAYTKGPLSGDLLGNRNLTGLMWNKTDTGRFIRKTQADFKVPPETLKPDFTEPQLVRGAQPSLWSKLKENGLLK